MTSSFPPGALFVTFEGGEGAGKSLLTRHFAERFAAAGREVVTTREPGGSPLGQEVRKLLLETKKGHAIGQRAELLLFLADRAQHVEELIRPALEAGKVVLCDRFIDSSIAYQGYGRGLDVSEVEQYCLLATGGLVPDVTLLLDLPPEQGLIRAHGAHSDEAGAGAGDRLEQESLAFHERVRQGFLSIAKAHPERVKVIDASVSAPAMVEQAQVALAVDRPSS